MLELWKYGLLWFSAGFYGYLIVHHTIQAFLSEQRKANLRLVILLVNCLVFSIVDSQLLSPIPVPHPAVRLLTTVQFVASVFCAVLFVELLNELLALRIDRGVRWLWGATAGLGAMVLLGLIVGTRTEVIFLPLLQGYYVRNASTPLGYIASALFLSAFLGAFGLAFASWRRQPPPNRWMLSIVSLIVPLVLVDMLTYYGILAVVPTWNLCYAIISAALSTRLNAQIYELTNHLRQAHEELQAAYRQMIEQERLSTIGQIVRGIVHDLKNFFNTVQSLADVGILRLKRDPTFDPADYFANIGSTTRKAHQYLLDMLEMTHEQGEMQWEEVSPAELVQEVARLSGARFLNPPVQVVNHIPTHLRMQADRRYMTQLFLNLTLNAIQAMRDWQGERLIEFGWIEQPDCTVLMMRDTGPGLPEQVSAHLFEREVTTKQGGSGLGLMLARRALEKHGAQVEVHSVPNAGTQFIFRFPTPPRFASTSDGSAVPTHPPDPSESQARHLAA
ncbi:Sporulation kinase A [bacterium HR15]|nr:Sporulation kinase A [bacterium HR15]